MLATDYHADALEFTAANAVRHALANVDTRLVDWRKPPDDLGTFDVVAASDVLDERPQAALVAAALARTIAPGGWASFPIPAGGPSPSMRFVKRGRAADPRDLARTAIRIGQGNETGASRVPPS